MVIKNVLIVGSGTMGQQISFQCAFSGFKTVVYDISDDALQNCKQQHQVFAKQFVAEMGASAQQVEAALSRLNYSIDLPAAAKDADLVNESVAENLEIKKTVYAQLNQHCPARTIFTTNTSTLLPSEISPFTGRPDKFLSLHFAYPIWATKLGEVMKNPLTDEAIFERVLGFAAEIGMVPIRLEKEQGGYVLNAILVPWLVASQSLVTNGVSSFSDVDRVWKLSTGMDKGPFGLMDMAGLETAYNVFHHLGEVTQDEQVQRNAQYLKENFIDQNKLGLKSGAGYYEYPNPAFEAEDFLTGSKS